MLELKPTLELSKSCGDLPKSNNSLSQWPVCSPHGWGFGVLKIHVVGRYLPSCQPCSNGGVLLIRRGLGEENSMCGVCVSPKFQSLRHSHNSVGRRSSAIDMYTRMYVLAHCYHINWRGTHDVEIGCGLLREAHRKLE